MYVCTCLCKWPLPLEPETHRLTAITTAFRFADNKRTIAKGQVWSRGSGPLAPGKSVPQPAPPGSQLLGRQWAVRLMVGGIWTNTFLPVSLSPREGAPWVTGARCSPQHQTRQPQAGLTDAVSLGLGRGECAAPTSHSGCAHRGDMPGRDPEGQPCKGGPGRAGPCWLRGLGDCLPPTTDPPERSLGAAGV